MPSDLAPDLNAAAAAAQSAQTAVVVVADDTESEATDRPGINLPSAQDELISAVAAANPHTVVVVDAGAPVAMPWLNQVASVVDAWYPGQSSGTSLADVLFGKVDPSGHLPVTFPTSLSQVPASMPEQFPGVNGQVLYSEGLDVGYRWYDAQDTDADVPVRLRALLHEVPLQRTARAVERRRRRGGRPRLGHDHQHRIGGGCRRRPDLSRRSGAGGRASASVGGLQEGRTAARQVGAGRVHGHAARYLVVGPDGRWLDAVTGRVPRLRRATPRPWRTCRCVARSRSRRRPRPGR